EAEAVEATDESTQTDPVNPHPLKASALSKTAAKRKAVSDPEESSPAVPTQTTAKSSLTKQSPAAPEVADSYLQTVPSQQSPTKPAATADKVSDLDLQAAP